MSISILVDNNALEEFEVTQKDDTHSCWVASQEDMVSRKFVRSVALNAIRLFIQNFEVRCEIKPSQESFCLRLYMDGVYMSGRIFETKSLRVDLIRGCPIGSDTIRLFAFSKVSLTGQSVSFVRLEKL